MPQIERIPPHAEAAEKSVLGAVLIDKEAFFKVSDKIRSDDFYFPAHREIYAAILELSSKGEPIDVITVTNCLKSRKSLDAAGGRAYVAALSQEIPTTANAEQYAKIVAEKAVLRRLISASADIVEKSYAENIESQKVLDHAEQVIFDIAKGRQTREYSRVQEVLEQDIKIIQEVEKNGGRLPGIPSGFVDLDRKTSGFQDSDLIIIGARPSMGKTAFALNIAQHAALKQGKRVVIFSLEMSKTQLGMRLLAMEARVDSNKLRTGSLSAEDWDSVNEAAHRFADADLIIDDTPGLSVMEIRNKCRRIGQEKRIDLILVDYIQLMSSDGTTGESRQQDVSQISRYLKQLAREMSCPVMVLSQLSRAVEQRKDGDKRPQLSDLRESGAIEQDADVVMFLYRDDYYNRNKDNFTPNNKCEVILAKQRMGETGKVELLWQPKYTKFVNIQKDDPQLQPPPSTI